jgi:hypothetical protein
MLLPVVQVEELEAQLQNTQDELRTEKALSKINQDAAADEVARAREEIKVAAAVPLCSVSIRCVYCLLYGFDSSRSILRSVLFFWHLF